MKPAAGCRIPAVAFHKITCLNILSAKNRLSPRFLFTAVSCTESTKSWQSQPLAVLGAQVHLVSVFYQQLICWDPQICGMNRSLEVSSGLIDLWLLFESGFLTQPACKSTSNMIFLKCNDARFRAGNTILPDGSWCVWVHVRAWCVCMCFLPVQFVIYLDCAWQVSSLCIMSDIIIILYVPKPSLSFVFTTAGADVCHRGRVDVAPSAVIFVVPIVHSRLQPITGSFTIIWQYKSYSCKSLLHILQN